MYVRGRSFKGLNNRVENRPIDSFTTRKYEADGQRSTISDQRSTVNGQWSTCANSGSLIFNGSTKVGWVVSGGRRTVGGCRMYKNDGGWVWMGMYGGGLEYEEG